MGVVAVALLIVGTVYSARGKYGTRDSDHAFNIEVQLGTVEMTEMFLSRGPRLVTLRAITSTIEPRIWTREPPGEALRTHPTNGVGWMLCVMSDPIPLPRVADSKPFWAQASLAREARPHHALSRTRTPLTPGAHARASGLRSSTSLRRPPEEERAVLNPT